MAVSPKPDHLHVPAIKLREQKQSETTIKKQLSIYLSAYLKRVNLNVYKLRKIMNK